MVEPCPRFGLLDRVTLFTETDRPARWARRGPRRFRLSFRVTMERNERGPDAGHVLALISFRCPAPRAPLVSDHYTRPALARRLFPARPKKKKKKAEETCVYARFPSRRAKDFARAAEPPRRWGRRTSGPSGIGQLYGDLFRSADWRPRACLISGPWKARPLSQAQSSHGQA